MFSQSTARSIFYSGGT